MKLHLCKEAEAFFNLKIRLRLRLLDHLKSASASWIIWNPPPASASLINLKLTPPPHPTPHP